MKKLIYVLIAVLALTSCREDPDLGDLSSDFLVFTNYDGKADFNRFTRYYMPDSVMVIGDTKDPEVWIGKLTYGSADSDARGSWDAWVEYINSDKGALLGGATNSWRDDSVLDNVKSWGVGIDYTLAKNVILTAAQTFGTQTKHVNAADPDEFTDVEINFLF